MDTKDSSLVFICMRDLFLWLCFSVSPPFHNLRFFHAPAQGYNMPRNNQASGAEHVQNFLLPDQTGPLTHIVLRRFIAGKVFVYPPVPALFYNHFFCFPDSSLIFFSTSENISSIFALFFSPFSHAIFLASMDAWSFCFAFSKISFLVI